MKSATPQITDANVRRLQQLQDAVDSAFSTHVSRHKAEIERHHAYFRENFPLLGLDLRAGDGDAAAEEQEQDPVPTKSDEISEEATAMTADQENEDPMPEGDPSAPEPATGDIPAINWRQLRRALPRRGLRRRYGTPRRQTVAAKSNPAAPPPTGPDTEEENRVLDEIAKFEAMLAARKPPAEAQEPPQSAPEPVTDGAAATPPPRRFSFGSLFDLAPRFRDAQAKDGGDSEG